MAKRKTTRKKKSNRKSGSSKKKSTRSQANGRANGSNAAFTARIRERFEEQVDEVRGQLDELENAFEKRFKDITDRVRQARKDVEKNDVVKRGKKAATNARKQASTTLKSGVSSLQEVLDLPTRKEIDKLTKKVEQLNRKVRTLENKSSRA